MSRRKNLTMAWIDYKQAYGIVPHSWIKECLDLFGVAFNIKQGLTIGRCHVRMYTYFFWCTHDIGYVYVDTYTQVFKISLILVI